MASPPCGVRCRMLGADSAEGEGASLPTNGTAESSRRFGPFGSGLRRREPFVIL